MALKKLTLRDNVHLSEKGYSLLAEKIIESAKELKSRQKSPSGHPQQKEDPLSGRDLQTWGGFFVTVGCGRLSVFKAPVKKGPRAQDKEIVTYLLRVVLRNSSARGKLLYQRGHVAVQYTTVGETISI